MSDKYCSAGKCECEHLRIAEHGLHRQLCTACGPTLVLTDFEVCPWPSRQVRVEPMPTSTESPYLIPMNETVEQTFDRGFTAGRREQARVDREAVEKIELPPDADWFRASTWVIAALTAITPKED